jgi:hypothetical protein
LPSADWCAPDATGSVAILISAALGVSAVGAFVFESGTTADEAVANLGTFIGGAHPGDSSLVDQHCGGRHGVAFRFRR